MTTPIQKTRYDGDVTTDIVREIGVAVHDRLRDAGRDVSRACYVVAGQVAWDECDCGQLAQSITSVVPTSSPPTPATDTRHTACGPGMVLVNVTLSLVRCVPTINENGIPPSCDVLDDAGVCLERDRHDARVGVSCYLRDLRRTYRVLEFGVGAATTVGPQGMCGGVELTYWFALHDDCCPVT